jgi:hypothetical protein
LLPRACHQAKNPGTWFVAYYSAYAVQDPIDTVVDDSFEFEARELRVAFQAGDDIWALKFASAAAFERFLQKYNKASFENRFGTEQNDASQAKARSVAVALLRAGSRRQHGHAALGTLFRTVWTVMHS